MPHCIAQIALAAFIDMNNSNNNNNITIYYRDHS